MQELLSVAPMMDWTTPHFRHVMRMVSRKTVLYTEMAVDNTIIHNEGFLTERVGVLDADGPAVIQLGGSNPETLSQASDILNSYGVLSGHYQELNINCGCPSNKVTQRGCFGAKLMLQPSLVREIVHSMKRRVSCPVTVKCRLGVTNHRDTYAELVEFITEAHLGGADKFIIHCRDCVLEGLSTKQNREIPPLRYGEIQRLRREFPDLTFVLNGGVQTLDSALEHLKLNSSQEQDQNNASDSSHLGEKEDEIWAPHGVMIGRAVMHDPLLLATADTRIFGCRKNPEITRRQILEDYGKYCDKMQDNMEDIINKDDREFHRSTSGVWNAYTRTLLGGVANIFSGVRGNKDYVKHVHPTDKDIKKYFNNGEDTGELISGKGNNGGRIVVSKYLEESTKFFSESALDQPLGCE